MILIAICITFVLVYTTFILFLWNHWRRLEVSENIEIQSPINVTVLVPFRNEAHNLPILLAHLQAQNVPSNIWWEVLLINDHSTDEFEHTLPASLPAQIHLISNEGTGKKAAIETGVKKAKGDLIITVDADVKIHPNWLQRIVATYQHKPASLYILPVMIEPSTSLGNQIQELEFASLMGTTLAMAHSGHPIMCNGANLAFEKSAFEALGGFQIGRQLASGDDLFLLFAMKKAKNLNVSYGVHPEMVAYTKAAPSLRAFISQRIRWGGKSKHYSDPPALWTALLVLIVNFIMLSSLLLGIFGIWPWYIVLIIWALKVIPDVIFISAVIKWFGRKSILWLSPLIEIAYPVYIVFTGCIGLVWKPTWKGRRI